MRSDVDLLTTDRQSSFCKAAFEPDQITLCWRSDATRKRSDGDARDIRRSIPDLIGISYRSTWHSMRYVRAPQIAALWNGGIWEKIQYFAKPNRYIAVLVQEYNNSIAKTLKLLTSCTKTHLCIQFGLGQSVFLNAKLSYLLLDGLLVLEVQGGAHSAPLPALQTAADTFSQTLFFFCWVPPAP